MRLLIPLLLPQMLATPTAIDTTALRRVIDSVVPALMREHRVPGVALVIVQGDSTVARRGYGTANRETGRPVDPERTVFRIASVAKLFVAAAALGEVERGRLDLRGDLRSLLSDIPIEGGGDAPVRLHDLLTHTAGFEERVVGMAAASAAGLRPLAEYLRDRMPRRGAEPGRWTSYSNHGFSLAALAVERTSGRDFADQARTAIFEPLRMTGTSYRRPLGDPGDLAIGYQCGDERCVVAPPVFSHTYPAGLAFSTAADMSRFMDAMLRPRAIPGWLSPAGVVAMESLQFTHDPAIDGIGYGFWRHRARTGELLLSHAGNVPGFVALLQLAPERQVGIFFAANGGSGTFARLLSEAILAAVLPGPAVAPLDPEARSGSAAELAGTYRHTRTARRSVETFPGLFQAPLTITASGDTAVVHLSSGPVPFLRTADGFASVDGQRRLAIRRDGRNAVSMVFVGQPAFGGEFPAAYQRLAWHDTPRFMNEYVSWIVAGPILVLLAWGLALVVGRVRRRLGRESSREPAPGWAGMVAVAVVVGTIVIGFGLVARTNRLMSGPLAYGPTISLQVLGYLPWLLGAATLLLVRGTWLGWRERWRWGSLVPLTLISVGAVAMVAFLARWGYLPLRW